MYEVCSTLCQSKSFLIVFYFCKAIAKKVNQLNIKLLLETQRIT